MQNSSQGTIIRAHVLISGRVQGVGYRYFTQQEAIRRHLQGWVRNLPDGRVEAVFEGNESPVKQIISWCHQGPKSAEPTDVIVTYQEPEGLQGFNILR